MTKKKFSAHNKQSLLMIVIILGLFFGAMMTVIFSEDDDSLLTGDVHKKIKRAVQKATKQVQAEVKRTAEKVEKEVSRTDENLAKIGDKIKDAVKEKDIGEEAEKNTREQIDKNLLQFIDALRQAACDKYIAGGSSQAARKDAESLIMAEMQKSISSMLSANALAFAAPKLTSDPTGTMKEVNKAVAERGPRLVDYATQKILDEIVKTCAAPVAPCVDSDNTYFVSSAGGGSYNPPGDDRYVAGTVTYGVQTYKDYCTNKVEYTDNVGNRLLRYDKVDKGNHIIEQGCIDGKTPKETTPFQCPNGCQNGACLRTFQQPTQELPKPVQPSAKLKEETARPKAMYSAQPSATTVILPQEVGV